MLMNRSVFPYNSVNFVFRILTDREQERLGSILLTFLTQLLAEFLPPAGISLDARVMAAIGATGAPARVAFTVLLFYPAGFFLTIVTYKRLHHWYWFYLNDYAFCYYYISLLSFYYTHICFFIFFIFNLILALCLSRVSSKITARFL